LSLRQIPKSFDGKMGFFQFPQLIPAIGIAGRCGWIRLHILQKRPIKDARKKFLEFMAVLMMQTWLNAALLQNLTARKSPCVDYYLNKR